MAGKIINTAGAYISCASSVVGKHEALGPMGNCFDARDNTDLFGAKTWELAESAMQKRTFEMLLKNSDVLSHRRQERKPSRGVDSRHCAAFCYGRPRIWWLGYFPRVGL